MKRARVLKNKRTHGASTSHEMAEMKRTRVIKNKRTHGEKGETRNKLHRPQSTEILGVESFNTGLGLEFLGFCVFWGLCRFQRFHLQDLCFWLWRSQSSTLQNASCVQIVCSMCTQNHCKRNSVVKQSHNLNPKTFSAFDVAFQPSQDKTSATVEKEQNIVFYCAFRNVEAGDMQSRHGTVQQESCSPAGVGVTNIYIYIFIYALYICQNM